MCCQGDQIGQIFDDWVTGLLLVPFCKLSTYTHILNIGRLFFTVKVLFQLGQKRIGLHFGAIFSLTHLVTWGRCYDHNFLQFLPIFGGKIGVFLKNQCYDQVFSKSSSSLRKKSPFFCKKFWRKYLKNHK
jgi:hypothetical protein